MGLWLAKVDCTLVVQLPEWSGVKSEEAFFWGVKIKTKRNKNK